jgi:iron complex outermembrane recepter protein
MVELSSIIIYLKKIVLRFMAYTGSRSNLQYLTTSAASEIIRDTEGFDFRWTRKDLFLNRPLNFTAGLAYDSMEDIRSRYSYTAPNECLLSFGN